MCPIRILLIEDDQDIGDLVQATLEPTYDCVRAANGLEGFQMALQGEPDLILSDIMMPVMDGYEFITRLRKEPQFKDVPVIFLSALGAREQIRKGYDLGATLYLTKPIDPPRLRRNVDLFIKDHGVRTSEKKMSLAQLKAALSAPFQAPGASEAEEEPTTRKRAAAAAAPSPQTDEEPTTKRRLAAETQKAPPSAPPPAQPVEKSKLVVKPAHILPSQFQTGAHKVRVMVVEDDRDAVEMLKAGLEPQYEVVMAFDGVEAVERIARYRPDVFVVDGMLPKMTGYQLAAMLKKNAAYHAAPIIFISGKATNRDRLYVEKLGVKHFLPKPFEIAQMQRILEQVTQEPGFTIREDRIAHQQITMETFRDFETHRTDTPHRTGGPIGAPKPGSVIRKEP